jgi:hypothetical protein
MPYSGFEAGSAGAPGGAPEAQAPAASPRGLGRSAATVLLWVYTATTFLSALLLFSVQPMFAKMVLPVLGGSPSVWAVAIFFFQAALLAGYCYAHLLINRAPLPLTGLLHLAVCLLAFLLLPIGLPNGWGEPPPGEPYMWQLGLFTVAIGLPFLAVSANAPLLQAWFARSGHPHGRDPYFLYAASNLGSLIALLSYPFVLEPALGLQALSRFWSLGFGLLIAALLACFVLMRRAQAEAVPSVQVAPLAVESSASRPQWLDRLGWIGLAAVPAALLTAFTTHVSTDIASAPLIWVLPLALYLLTFVLVFREQPLIPRPILLVLHLASVVVALLMLAQTKHETWYLTALTGVAVFFMTAMVAHRTLYENRPAARFLTEFYLWMSFGGALGGLAAALIAPKVFSEVFEYPLLLALSMACRPGAVSADALRRTAVSVSDSLARLLRQPWLRLRGAELEDAGKQEFLVLWLIIAGSVLLIYWVPWAIEKFNLNIYNWGTTTVVVAAIAAVLVASYRFPQRQLVAALLMFCAVVVLPSAVRRGEAQRSYFGVYRVMHSADGEFNVLMHGTTLHGAQHMRDEDGNADVNTVPATYYYPESPIAQTVAKVRELATAEGRKPRIGITGLGAGSLSCHSKPGEPWRFFEIDPVVIGIARNPKYFTFLNTCQPTPDIVVGDARLTIAKEADASFDLMVMDAFTSDAVPVHLLTAEAIKLYLSKLKPNGVVLLHISNRYLDLESVVGATVGALPHAAGIIISDDTADGTYAESTSTVALVAKSREALDPFRGIHKVFELEDGGLRPWTDDYSDILGPFINRYRHR